MKKRRRAYLIPVLAGIILVIINLNTGWLFSVSSKGGYSGAARRSLCPYFFADVANRHHHVAFQKLHLHIETRSDLKTSLFSRSPVVAPSFSFFYTASLSSGLLVLSCCLFSISSLNGRYPPMTHWHKKTAAVKPLSLRSGAQHRTGRRLYAIIVDIDASSASTHLRPCRGRPTPLSRRRNAQNRCAARNCFLARIGGDEFAIVLTAETRVGGRISELIRRRFLRLFVDEKSLHPHREPRLRLEDRPSAVIQPTAHKRGKKITPTKPQKSIKFSEPKSSKIFYEKRGNDAQCV